jgi:hypothetical protein
MPDRNGVSVSIWVHASGEAYKRHRPDSSSFTECHRWPSVFSGTVPDRIFTDNEEEAIIALMDEKALNGIKIDANAFLRRRKYYGETTINDLNEKLFLAGKHAADLAKLLEDKKLLAYLQNTIHAQLGYERAAEQSKSDETSILLPYLDSIIWAANSLKEYQSRAGRRKGQAKIAEHILVEALYDQCIFFGQRPTNNPNGMLQKLLVILNRPLDLGGTLPGIVRQVINERKHKKHPLQPNI